MRERGILMSGPMALATYRDLKTQTRRTRGLEEVNAKPDAWRLHQVGTLGYGVRDRFKGRFGAYFHSETIEPGVLSVCPVVCPFGNHGDRFYVKETYTTVGYLREWGVEIHYAADGHDPARDFDARMRHRRTLAECPDRDDKWRPNMFGRWRPSMFMPKWASRSLLEITGVRVERLQGISEEDARAEGVEPYTGVGLDQRVPGPGFGGVLLAEEPHRLPFSDLWDSINGEGAWERNDWVWALTFKRIEQEERAA